MKRPLTFVKQLVLRYFDHGCGRTGAALAYYSLFSLFPFLFFLSQLLGLLNLQPITLSEELARIIPSGAIDFFNAYLEHVADRGSGGMLALGLITTLYFPMRAVVFLMQTVSKGYDVTPHRTVIKEYMISFLVTLLLGFMVFLSLVFILLGSRALTYLSGAFSISPQFIAIWGWLRFLALGILLFFVLSFLYQVSAGKKFAWRYVFPGAGAAIVAWIIISAGFSFYVNHFANYSVVYGSLGTVIVLLIWLFLSSVTIVMGAELNGLLMQRKK